MTDYKLQHLVLCLYNRSTISLICFLQAYEMNKAAAALCKECVEEAKKKNPEIPRFVMGVMGPTNRTASVSPKVEDPGYRNVSTYLD